MNELVGMWLAWSVGGLVVGAQDVGGGEDVEASFREHVAPLLSQRCVRCHHAGKPSGGVLLSESTGWHDIVDADLLRVVTPVEGRARMPKGDRPLSDVERRHLDTWLRAGRPWPSETVLTPAMDDAFDWWSFQRLARPVVPVIAGDWSRNPIDRFILDGLARYGLTPSPEADRRTLIRRVTFDLIGLPPTPREVEAFVTDLAPDAYERVVDRLLASPHYGERWARHWLDVVKYADTAGYDKDKLRPNAWPYRDYVVRSFNDDKPYRRFVQEQIAGDALFPESADGILGLGFLAAGPWDFIGHVEVPESKIDGMVARALDRDDMVGNTLNAFCSVTVQCARCHDHKFDPITQEAYFGLQAVFSAVDRADRPLPEPPDVAARRVDRERAVADAEQRAALAERAWIRTGGDQWAALSAEVREAQRALSVQQTPAYGFHSALSVRDDEPVWVAVELGTPVLASRIVLQPCHDRYADIGAGFGFPRQFSVEVAGEASPDAEWTSLFVSRGDVPNPGLGSWSVPGPSTAVQRVRIRVERRAERTEDFLCALGELRVLDEQGNDLAIGAVVTSSSSIEAPPRWGRSLLTDGMWAEPMDSAASLRLTELLAEQARLRDSLETPDVVAQRDAARAELESARRVLESLPAPSMVYAAATHFTPQGAFRPTEGVPRPVHVLHRGDVREPRSEAIPGALPLARGVPWQFDHVEAEEQRRAALAQWITDREHPWTWRSVANRLWHYHFGRGLVETPNDFGRMGQLPTHPELLDWLAVEFRDSESWKDLHRLIVTSRAYCQSSAHRPECAAVDASNRMLWRGHRRRLEAEELRDAVLAASGQLDRTMGGAGDRLFGLENPEHSPHYEYHLFDPAEAKRHRRGVYRFVVRSQPDPWMSTFDCADSSQSTPRRSETLTPLQALSLYNSRFTLVMAEQWARQLERESSDVSVCVQRAVRTALQRPERDEEREALIHFAREHGMANLCRVLFNLSEFLYLD